MASDAITDEWSPDFEQVLNSLSEFISAIL